MGKGAIEALVSVVSLVIGVAIVAVVVSKNSGTAGVIQAGGTALKDIIGAAVAPVSANTGLNTQINH